MKRGDALNRIHIYFPIHGMKSNYMGPFASSEPLPVHTERQGQRGRDSPVAGGKANRKGTHPGSRRARYLCCGFSIEH